MRRTTLWLLLLVVFATTVRRFRASVAPPPNYTPTFCSGHNCTRTNYCHRVLMLRNGSLLLADFLADTTVTIAVNDDVAPFYMTLSPNNTMVTGGFMYNLHNQIAARGGFKIKYVVTPGISAYPSRLDYFRRVLPYVDLWASAVGPAAPELLNIGVGTSVRVLDQSLVFLTKQYVSDNAFNLWAFLAPFSNGVWAAICGVIVCAAFANAFITLLEKWMETKGPSEAPKTFATEVFNSFSGFARFGFTVSPLSATGRIARLGYAFFLLIIIASYTANLASYLMILQQPTYKFMSLQDVSAKGGTVCVKDPIAIDLLARYPRIRVYQLASKTNPVPVVQALSSGQCDAALLYKEAWITAQGVPNANPNCDIVQVGGPIIPIDGAWMFAKDYSQACTAAMGDAYSYLLATTLNDGSFDQLYQFSLNYFWSQACAPFASSTTNMALTINGLAGVFVTYLGCAAVALVTLACWVCGKGFYPLWFGEPDKVMDYNTVVPHYPHGIHNF